MSKFGWSYPAGAENDPYAPYNQTDDESEWDRARLCEYGELLGITPTADALRATYKCEDSGAVVGVLLPNGERLFPGSAADMAKIRALPDDEPVEAWIVSGCCCGWEYSREVARTEEVEDAIADFADALADHQGMGPEYCSVAEEWGEA